jgi:penicillin-binding protein 1A
MRPGMSEPRPPDETTEPKAKPRVRWSWKKRIWVGIGIACATLLVIVAAVTAGLYVHFSKGLPEIPKVSAYWPPVLSEVYTDDQVLAGEFYDERRKMVPYEHVPKRLVQAFIASEDQNFFDHHGVDVLGTMRAAFKTIMKKASGEGSVQGGSTLTQQTAKAVLISAEGYKAATERGGKAGLIRKIREAILAHRLEQALTKEEILYLYLNNVYLGHHSYGVQSAAENYFRKDVRDLSLAEMALIAGLPQAPSAYSPFEHPQAAKHRRGYVLRRMLEEHMISQAEHDAAAAEDVDVFPVEDVFHQFAPYFVEQVRKDVVNRYGNPELLKEGLKIFTTMDSERQRAAQDAMLHGLLAVDKRQGFRGPLMTLAEADRAAFVAKSDQAMGDEKLTEGSYYVGLVTHLAEDGLWAEVQVGHQKGILPLLGMRWARKVNPEGYYPALMLNTIKGTLKAGDVIVVRCVPQKELVDDKEQYDKRFDDAVPKGVPLFRLEQEPELQGALVSIAPHQQYMTAMVGGYDFDANEYNRAFQACRQPGSNWKPITYSAAIEQLNWTEATVIVDSPIVEDDPEHQTRWKPENFGDNFHGDVLLKYALENSMNIPAVKTFAAVGIKNVADWAHKLGLSTPMNMDYSAALGSSCVYPQELAQVYSTFNRQGVKRPTYFVRKVEDRFGRMLEDHTSFDDPWSSFEDRLAAGYARLYEPGERVMSPETAFILTDILRGVVKEGTGMLAQRIGKPAAGKTGTTNDSFDGWFSGFTQDLEASVWVGYDKNEHPLGRYETGGRAALPMWIDYMKKALGAKPQAEFAPAPELADNLVQLNIDLKTGNIAPDNAKNSEKMWFKKGTEPTEAQPEKGKVDPHDIMSLP